MPTRSVATVFGGSGFLGRYLVKRLASVGYVVRVAVRDPEAALFLKPMGRVGQIVPLYAPVQVEDAVARAVEGTDLVVNLVGILAERKSGDFQRVHAEGAARVARLAAAAGSAAMVQISAIGADPGSDSLYARSKADGEAGVRAAFSGATILRPSIVFGLEDQFFNRFATMASWLPVMPVIAGETKIQPVYVGDVADAIMAVLRRADAAGAIYELGGPQVFTLRQMMEWILKATHRQRRLVNLPHGLVALQAALGEHLPGKPFTRDQLRMLGHDNVCNPALPGLSELGVVPTPVDMIVPDYLVRFRPGGVSADRVQAEIRSLSGPITPGPA
jgi:uncharacterized protein YbjT (DUF2867 family)